MVRRVFLETVAAAVMQILDRGRGPSSLRRPAYLLIPDLWADQEFQTDWTGDAWIEVAEPALGALEEGQCYGFKIWPILGGAYEVENMVVKSMLEWLAVSGGVGRQIKDLPSGTQIRLDVRDA